MNINTASHASHQKVTYTVWKGAQLPRRPQLAFSNWDTLQERTSFFGVLQSLKKEKKTFSSPTSPSINLCIVWIQHMKRYAVSIKTISKLFQSEIPSQARRKEWLSHPKFKQAFLIFRLRTLNVINSLY